jgi:invasin-like protein/quinohemoprotein amine dehydrogenase alpha subunit-like protein/IPT/TIG domain-containing protein
VATHRNQETVLPDLSDLAAHNWLPCTDSTAERPMTSATTARTSNRGATLTPLSRTARSLRGLATVTAACVAAALVAAPPAYAASTVSAATGGTTMTAANAGPSATYTTLGNIVVTEQSAGEVSTGRFTLKVPTGFEFRTTSVTLSLAGAPGNKKPDVSLSASCTSKSNTALTITPTVSAITFYVCAASTDSSTFTLSSLAVRPTASTPVASGNIYLDNSAGGVTISGVTSGPTGTNFGTLTQNPGATTQLGVVVPGSVTAGVAQSVTVTARDAYGNTTPAYRGAVRFTSTDPAAVLPADYTFTAADAGVHVFGTPVFKTAGARSLTVTDKVTSSITGVGSTTVVAASASTMSLSGIGNPTTAGAAASGTVVLRDGYGNVATGYRGTVHFSSTDPAATLPADYTFTATDAGTRAFPVTLRSAGNRAVTVTDSALTATQSPITVQPGPLHHLALSPATSTVTAGGSAAFTAQGRDASENNLGDVTAGTTFTIAPNGSCSGAVCTATVAGPHTVTGTNSGATGTASLTVTPTAPVLTLQLTPGTLVADGAATSTALIQVADQYGNPRAADPVTLSTNGDATISAVHDNGDGSYTATVTASTVAGSQTITAVNGSATGTAQLVQVPGPASAVTLALSSSTVDADGTSTTTATITVADAHGNSRAGDAVTLVSDGDATVSAITDRGFGTYTATVTASTTAGTQTLTATAGAASATAQLVQTVPLAVTAVSPDSRGTGANGGAFGQSVTVTGTGFTAGALADFGPGLTVKFTTYTDASHLIAHVVVAPDAEVGTRSVTVTLADGRTATCAGCFTVTPGPSVSDVSPNQIGPGAQRTVTVTGANFAPGVKVTVPASGVAVTSVTVVDSTALSVGLSTAGVAAPGPRDLIITNPGDAGSTTCGGCFTVTDAPVVTAVSPAVLGGGAQTTVTVTGANLVAGARLSVAGAGVAVLTQSWVDDAHLTATLSVAGAATAGGRTITVINPDGGKGACASCFAVASAPTVTGLTPATFARGSTTAVTITGTNFRSGAAVSLSTGVSVQNVIVVDAATITATVAVSATTGTGNRTLVVTNPDFGKGTCSGCAKVS